MTRFAAWFPVVVLALFWADLVRLLSFHWSTNPQYAFGWSVPFLSLLLLWEAWTTRPAIASAKHQKLCIGLSSALAFSLLPIHLFFEATPDWRIALWTAGFAVIGLLLTAVYIAGGRPWLKHFAFPLAFLLVAVPWPGTIELPLIQWLTNRVTTLTVAGLNLLGTPALRHGNLIEISKGVVGVQEACSGIRSFQSALMAALFLGQFFMLRWQWRLALVGIGAAVAFGLNVVRASLLTYVADRDGINAIARWHDPAGYTILMATFVVLAVLALIIRDKNAPHAEPAPVPHAEAREPRELPIAWITGLAVWALVVTGGTELWYRSAKPAQVAWWRIEWPTHSPSYAEIPVFEVLRQLHADEARGATWLAGTRREFTMYAFRWLPGPTSSRMLARFHRPEFCMPSAGTTLIREMAPEPLHVGDTELVFRTYLFTLGDKPIHVFFCVWEDAPPLEPGKPLGAEWSPRIRWRAVMEKRRKLGQQVLEVGITNAKTDEAAREEFRRTIEPLLRPDPAPEIAAH